MLDPVNDPGGTRRFLGIPAPLLALAGALLTGLALRLWGIEWGFPRVDLSPDELNVWNISARLRWDNLDTGFYNYSGLTFYLNFFAAQLLRLLGVTLEPHTILLVNRLWSVLFGTMAILLAYLAARDLFEDARAGAWAAWALALLPIHVWHSHFGTSDIGLTFWILAVFWLAVRAYRRPTARRFLLGGLAVGVAVGVKFNGLLAAVPLVAAALAAWRQKRVGSLRLVAGLLVTAGAAALAGFFLVSPFSLIHLRETVEAYFFETRHVKGGHYGFDLSPAGFPYYPYVYQLFAAFPYSFGLPFYLVTLASLVYFAFRPARAPRLLGLSFPLIYLGILASWKFVPTRYYLPALPILLVLASGGFRRAWKADRRCWRLATRAAALLVLAYTLAYDVTTVDRFRRDTRLEAARWADAALPEGTRIVLVEPIFDRGYIVPAGSPGPMPFAVPPERVMDKSYMPLFDRQRFQVPTRDLVRTVADLQNGRLGRGDILCVSALVFLRDVRLGRKAAERLRLWNYIRRNPRKLSRLRVFDTPFLHRGLYAALDPMYACDFVSPAIEFYAPRTRRKP
ncbi:MAG: glycosyltransferase family 39 protein [Candidatus Aminicenantes bacterium]|nr:glycosyltransferase family 39 protein [Candidatus Aminicenantes bacterium]